MLGAAGIALAGVIISAVITTKIANNNSRIAAQSAKTAMRSAGHSKRSADAAITAASAADENAKYAKSNAEASERSSKAAVEAVGVNRETASAVATRANADALAKRYQDAAAQLGHDQAPVRLAGVYAMARLADDWPEYRQECVDVLCAYLRMKWTSVMSSTWKGSAEPPETEVRRTIVDLIAAHVEKDVNRPWSTLQINLRGAELPHLRIRNGQFRLLVDFRDTTFLERPILSDCTFDRGADFQGARFLRGIRIDRSDNYGPMDFGGITLPTTETAALTFNFIGEYGSVKFEGELDGQVTVVLQPSAAEQGSLILGTLTLSEKSEERRMAVMARTLNPNPSANIHIPRVVRQPQGPGRPKPVELLNGLKILQY